jgi:predicted nucleic acid-binding protein
MKDDKVFVDTNILIYAYDVSASRKHEVARQIVSDLWNSGYGVLSIQVLQEFFVNVTQNIPKPLDRRLARDIVADFLKWEVIINDGESILEAVDVLLRYGLSFWDALIVGAAARSGAAVLLSEDLKHGQVIHGLTIRNPFEAHPGA